MRLRTNRVAIPLIFRHTQLSRKSNSVDPVSSHLLDNAICCGMALRAAYLALSDVMGGKSLARHWEEHFVSPASSDMFGGHSLASSTMALLSTSTMRPSENLATSLGIATEKVLPGTPSGSAPPTPHGAPLSSDSELAKAQKRIAHLERQEKEMISAKNRRDEVGRRRGDDRYRSGAFERDQRDYNNRTSR